MVKIDEAVKREGHSSIKLESTIVGRRTEETEKQERYRQRRKKESMTQEEIAEERKGLRARERN